MPPGMVVSALLVLCFIQMCRSQHKYCEDAGVSVETVDTCPSSKEAWDSAARAKNCQEEANRHNCTFVDMFRYHCLMNSYRNETLEVCAPEKIISGGYCTEFNEVGGIVQFHEEAKCNNTGFPKCEAYYRSTEAYKFQDCYKLVNKTEKHSPAPGASNNHFNHILVAVFVITTSIGVTLLGFWAFKKRKKKCTESQKNNRKNKDREEAVGFIDEKGNGKEERSFDGSEKSLADDKAPGEPYAEEVKFSSVCLSWETAAAFSTAADCHFKVYFRSDDTRSYWMEANATIKENHATITNLKANTEYMFQIRRINDEEQEKNCGPASEKFKTKKSLKYTFLKTCDRQTTTSSFIYRLPLKENKSARNESARTRQLTLGEPCENNWKEKTILLLGETGSGKTTMVDAIINYIIGVNYKDQFRFTMKTLEKEEEEKDNNQALSQTEWITVYKIYPMEESRVNYTLKIIDTPGFGDTRGIERDKAITSQIRQLFSMTGEEGLIYIDALCFIVKAPDARLTIVQKYIINSVMAMFGKDIESNICTLITFADGSEPPVVASLKECGLSFGPMFTFNNSALFAENKKDVKHDLFLIYWELGKTSFEKFFEHIFQLEAKILDHSNDVLFEREELNKNIDRLGREIADGVSKITELRQNQKLIKKYTERKLSNLSKEIKVEEDQLCAKTKLLINQINKCMKKLKEIALTPGPSQETDYIDLAIEYELKRRDPGYHNRIRVLDDMKVMNS